MRAAAITNDPCRKTTRPASDVARFHNLSTTHSESMDHYKTSTAIRQRVYLASTPSRKIIPNYSESRQHLDALSIVLRQRVYKHSEPQRVSTTP